MATVDSLASKWAPRLLSLMRIVVALLFMLHGSQKVFGYPSTQQPANPFNLLSTVGIAGVLEFFGGLLVLIGLFTRPVSFILSGQMAVAYFWLHAAAAFWPIINRGELAVLYCFVFLYLAAAGGGPWSLDAILRRKK